ncbi:MAG: hypothetical protein HC765_14905 [Brachymonas sp.]|nr:hypothetical protein [Brachymonas sp.]
MTAQFRLISPNRLEGVFTPIGLPVGAVVLKLFSINEAKQWAEVGSLPLQVVPVAQAHASGQDAAGKKAVIKPSLVLGLKSQLHESHSASAPPPVRSTYADATLQASLQTDHGDEEASFKSSWNVVGSSYQNEAINFGSQGVNAPKIDLANYLVESRLKTAMGITQLAAGHIQAGNHPLLASSLANRGMSISQQWGPRLDASLALQYGSALVGASHLLPLMIETIGIPLWRWVLNC